MDLALNLPLHIPAYVRIQICTEQIHWEELSIKALHRRQLILFGTHRAAAIKSKLMIGDILTPRGGLQANASGLPHSGRLDRHQGRNIDLPFCNTLLP